MSDFPMDELFHINRGWFRSLKETFLP